MSFCSSHDSASGDISVIDIFQNGGRHDEDRFVTGFAKTVLKGILCILRNINLIRTIKVTVVHLCYNVATPDTQYE